MKESDEASSEYTRQLGSRLRHIRMQKGIPLQGVEASTGQEFKASVLGAYERGERAVSVPRLQRLASFYGVPVDQLLPREGTPSNGSVGEAGDTMDAEEERRAAPRIDRGIGGNPVTIDLTRLQHMDVGQRDMLTRYLFRIQMERQDFNGRVLTIRNEDLRTVACLLRTTPTVVRRQFSNLRPRHVTTG